MGRTRIADTEPTVFVDESLRPGPQGLYVVAAAVVIDDVAMARVAAEKAPPSGKRFHWKDERDPSRLTMLDVLRDLGCGLWTYECQPCPTRKQERARAKCLQRLVWDMRTLGVHQL